jgi:ribosomal protein L37AE/L43A
MMDLEEQKAWKLLFEKVAGKHACPQCAHDMKFMPFIQGHQLEHWCCFHCDAVADVSDMG